MNHEFAYEEAQRHLKQRNRFAALAGVLGLTTVLAVGAGRRRTRLAFPGMQACALRKGLREPIGRDTKVRHP